MAPQLPEVKKPTPTSIFVDPHASSLPDPTLPKTAIDPYKTLQDPKIHWTRKRQILRQLAQSPLNEREKWLSAVDARTKHLSGFTDFELFRRLGEK